MSVIEADVRPQLVVRGVTLIVAAMFITSVQDVVFKFFSNSLPLGQIFALRALLALPLFFALAWVQGHRSDVLVGALKVWPLLRALFITLMFLSFYAAIPFVSLSILGAGTYLAPIFVTLMSAYFIGEPVRPRGWIAVLIGFAGVIILLQPGTGDFTPWAILPMIGALFYALAHIITRTKCLAISPTSMALSWNIIMLVAGLIISGILLVAKPGEELVQSTPYIFGGWSSLGHIEWLTLGLLAALSVVISLGIAGAYQAAPPSIVATFEYCYLIFVTVWDFLFFATLPSFVSILGILMIIGAGLMILNQRES